MRFRSKVDTWLVVLLAIAGLAALLGSASLLGSGAAGALGVAILTTLVALGLPVWLLFATHYTFEGNELRIQGGPLRWTVPVDQIHSVRPSRSVWSSPALSLDRLRIDYGKGRWILISPEDREGFLAELAARRSSNSQPRNEVGSPA
jgi:hypothetical protein